MNKKIFILILLVLAVAGGVYFFLVRGKISSPFSKKAQAPSLGEQIYSQLNPVEEKLPQTNPFAVETNPYKVAYPNPFK